MTLQRIRALAVADVFAFLAKQGLTLGDLLSIDGATSSNRRQVEKARRVENCWSLMAKLGVKFADLESSSPPIPDKPSRRRRGEGVSSQVTENKELSATGVEAIKSSEINDLADLSPVGVPETKSNEAA
jgi:hypothetical protein